jgi:hypothetical protein
MFRNKKCESVPDYMFTHFNGHVLTASSASSACLFVKSLTFQEGYFVKADVSLNCYFW